MGWGSNANQPDDVTLELNSSSQVAVKDGGVGTTQIADNAVDKDKMAHGTADKYLGFDGSGVPAELDAPSGGNDGTITIIHADQYDAVNAGTWITDTNSMHTTNTRFRNSSSADGDGIDYSVYLAAGTYTAYIEAETAADSGIIEILVDAVSKGTVDIYTGSTVQDIVKITGINITSSGQVTLRVAVNGKNASSSSYRITMGQIVLKRTGDAT